MSKEEIIRIIRSFNGSLDIKFLEELSAEQLDGYARHLKAVRAKIGSSEAHRPQNARTD